MVSRKPLIADDGPLVTLTTHGRRLASVHLAIESIGAGELRPHRIVLWLSGTDAIDPLPRALRRQRARGLEIRLSEDFGPHTKYYPLLEAEHDLQGAVVTADDDVIYPKFWLAGLAAAFAKFPEHINCYRARRIQFDGPGMAPYLRWRLCDSTDASFQNFATGVSGAIYPPRFCSVLREAGRKFLERCPKNDDIWLHLCALRTGYRVRQILAKAQDFPEIPGSQAQSLWSFNQGVGGNDAQIAQTYETANLALLRSEIASGHDRVLGDPDTITSTLPSAVQ